MFERLLKKKESHSKVKNVRHERFEMSDYLKPNGVKLCKEEAQFIFKVRSRVTNVKINQRGKFDDLICRICEEDEESQEHVFLCKDLKNENESNEVEYQQIFNGSVEEKLKVCKKMQKKLKILEKNNP